MLLFDISYIISETVALLRTYVVFDRIGGLYV